MWWHSNAKEMNDGDMAQIDTVQRRSSVTSDHNGVQLKGKSVAFMSLLKLKTFRILISDRECSSLFTTQF